MNKRGLGFFTLILFLTALTIGGAVSVGNLNKEQVYNISDKFRANIHEVDFNFNETTLDKEIGNALDFYITGILYAYAELTSWTMKWSLQHPNIPYNLLLYGLVLAIISPIVIALFKLLLIIFLLIKEYKQKKKEKQLIMKRMKGGKN